VAAGGIDGLASLRINLSCTPSTIVLILDEYVLSGDRWVTPGAGHQASVCCSA
jgi:hypothetical protein